MAKMIELEFQEELNQIIKTYKQGEEEPLDGDDVDRLTEHIRNQLNLIEGNITQEEYLELEK